MVLVEYSVCLVGDTLEPFTSLNCLDQVQGEKSSGFILSLVLFDCKWCQALKQA